MITKMVSQTMNYGIKSQNRELAYISYIRDKNKYAIYSPQVLNGYVGIQNENLDDLAIKLGIDTYVPNEINEIKIDKLLEQTKIEQKHIENYYKLFKNNTPDSSYSKNKNSKVKIEDKTYNTTEYVLKLSAKDSANMQIELLSKLSQDSIMMDYITSKARLINIDNYLSDINKLNAKMKERIENLKNAPEIAEEITISVNEYKQKHIKTTISLGDYTISFYNIKEDDLETSVYCINDINIKVSKSKSEYTVKYTNKEDDIEKSIQVKYRLEGTVEDNNIKKIMEITHVNGIKSVNYMYTGNVTFTNDIGNIKDLNDEKIAILNDYSKEDIMPFITSLKKKINDVYREKGTSLGINLDPIFEVEQ